MEIMMMTIMRNSLKLLLLNQLKVRKLLILGPINILTKRNIINQNLIKIMMIGMIIDFRKNTINL